MVGSAIADAMGASTEMWHPKDIPVKYTSTNTLADENIKKHPDHLDDQIEKIDWIKKWARVALAYQAYTDSCLKASNRF